MTLAKVLEKSIENLHEMDCFVTRIDDSEENLEDYFSKLIGGGGIA